MTDYKVVWESDVTADSPREAAERARADQVRPGSWATVFDVTDPNGVTWRIDLMDDAEEPPSVPNGHGDWPWEREAKGRQHMERSP
jgi:hypothetical protein